MIDSATILQEAVSSMIETAGVQFELDLVPAAETVDFKTSGYSCGSAIGLNSASGVMLLVMLCDLNSAEEMTRLLFAMDEDEEIPIDDTADALMEIINVAGGVLKTRLARMDSEFELGLPLFLEGDTCLEHIRHDSKDTGRRLESETGVSLNVNVIWREGPCHEPTIT